MKSLSKRPNARVWLAIVGSATILIGTMYATAQTITRLSANDLARQTADITRENIEKPHLLEGILPNYNVDLKKDNSVFVIIMDKNGKVLTSNAFLDGNNTITPPKGVLAHSANVGHDAVTWQPASGVRIASYTEPYKNGFITAGQSLKTYEQRVNVYTALAFVAWLGTITWTTLTLWVWKPRR